MARTNGPIPFTRKSLRLKRHWSKRQNRFWERVLGAPHLYGHKADSEIIQKLRATNSSLIVACWLFLRTTRWLLDHLEIRGQAQPRLMSQAMSHRLRRRSPVSPSCSSLAAHD